MCHCLEYSPLPGLVLQETYRCVSHALYADLTFIPSFDKSILKNLGHWLVLQAVTQGITVSIEALPLRDIITTAFKRGTPDLLFTIPFVAQLLLAGSSSMLFQPSHPWVRDIHFNNLSPDILDFQSPFVENLSQLSLDQVSAMDDLDITFISVFTLCIHKFVTLGWD